MPPETNDQNRQEPDLTAALQRLIDRNGGNQDAVGVMLMRENHDLREERRQLRTQVSDLEKKVPGDGVVVLSADDVKKWQAYQALNLTPEQVTEVVTERDTLKGSLAEKDRSERIRNAAEAAGFKPAVLMDLTTAKGLHVEVRDEDVEVTEGGKKVTRKGKVPYVRPAGDEKAQLVKLTTYVDQNLADYKPALQATATKQNGVPFPEQNGSDGTAPASNLTDKFIQGMQKTAESGNALKPAKQPA